MCDRPCSEPEADHVDGTARGRRRNVLFRDDGGSRGRPQSPSGCFTAPAATMSAAVVDAGDGLPLTVPALLHERVATRGDHPWLICDDDVLTYAAAAERSAAL